MKRILLMICLLPLLVKAQNCKTIPNSVTGKSKKIGLLPFSASNLPALNFINEGDGFSLGYAMKCSVKKTLPASIYLVFTFDDGSKKKISITQASTDDLEEKKRILYFSIAHIPGRYVLLYRSHADIFPCESYRR